MQPGPPAPAELVGDDFTVKDVDLGATTPGGARWLRGRGVHPVRHSWLYEALTYSFEVEEPSPWETVSADGTRTAHRTTHDDRRAPQAARESRTDAVHDRAGHEPCLQGCASRCCSASASRTMPRARGPNPWSARSSASLRSATCSRQVTPIDANARVAGAPIFGSSDSVMRASWHCLRAGRRSPKRGARAASCTVVTRPPAAPRSYEVDLNWGREHPVTTTATRARSALASAARRFSSRSCVVRWLICHGWWRNGSGQLGRDGRGSRWFDLRGRLPRGRPSLPPSPRPRLPFRRCPRPTARGRR